MLEGNCHVFQFHAQVQEMINRSRGLGSLLEITIFNFLGTTKIDGLDDFSRR
jgi:hypothetical protein